MKSHIINTSEICLLLFILLHSCNLREQHQSREKDTDKTNELTEVKSPLVIDDAEIPAESSPAENALKKNASEVYTEPSINTTEHISIIKEESTHDESFDFAPDVKISGTATEMLCSPSVAPIKTTFSGSTITLMDIHSSETGSYTYVAPTAVTVPGAEPSSSRMAFDASLAGQLTAGEINDFQKWKMWEDIAEDELHAYREIWKINPSDRYSVVVQTEFGSPIIDAVAELISKTNEVIWTARTDNTGKAELWSVFDMDVPNKRPDLIRITSNGQVKKIDRPKTIGQGINSVYMKTPCNIPNEVDLLFTVDATGSMGDEIAYLQAELIDVISKVRNSHEDISLNLGSVFYRDHGDTYVTKSSPFSTDISQTIQFISEQYADGGGDGPEAVDDALEASLNEMEWSKTARARMMILILDAPPHAEASFLQKLKKNILHAASKGVRIIPLVASGGGYDVDKSLEYLMRSCALATNGTYAFLTDHSGVGGSHTAPTTDEYDVEKLNDLLIRIVGECLFVPDCNTEEFLATQNPSDTSTVSAEWPQSLTTELQSDSTQIQSDSTIAQQPIFILKCFPNPATNYVWVETSEPISDLYLADHAGKIVQRLSQTTTLTRLDLTGYPTGIYYIKAWIDEKWASAKIVVAHI